MIALTAAARCRTCPWTAGPGDPAAIDRAAERHVKTSGHAVATTAVPKERTT